MTADPREEISEITEIDDRIFTAAIRAFLRAVKWGAIAGGGIWLLMTVPIGVGMALDGEAGPGLGVALMPLAIAGAGSLAGMLLIGLPLTALLRELRNERCATYALVGMIAGFIAPSLVVALLENFNPFESSFGLFLGIFGAISGGVAGHVWGSWREQLQPQPEPASAEPTPSPNPIHDLLF